MDAVSYSHSAKQAQRIKKIIANPDSTSGVVTVPSTIATGETITIPAGRTAILPDVTVEGDLLVDGTVFIPTGTTYTQETLKTEAISNVAGSTVVNVTDIVSKVGNQTMAGTKTFTSSPLAPTPTAGDNSTKVATTAYVDGKMVRGVAVTASGTSIDFIGIPSWVKRITVLGNAVSGNGSSNAMIQLGSTTFTVSGYKGSVWTAAGSAANFSNGFLLTSSISAPDLKHFTVELNNISGNTWTMSIAGGFEHPYIMIGGGTVSLSGVLDRIRVTHQNGTDVFDAGQINIMYEG